MQWMAIGSGILRTTALVALVAPVAAAAVEDETAQPPNVLVIMTDQHSARALRCYGNTEIETPNLDRLAREGVRFANALTPSPQCCPARMSILTGRYPRAHGLHTNGVPEPDMVTVADVLRAAGYRTAAIGKMHTLRPVQSLGFDVSIERADYLKAVALRGAQPARASGDWTGIYVHGDVGASHASNENHPAGYWAERTLGFLREGGKQPFCAWLSFYGPHTPIIASQPWADQYEPEGLSLPPNFAAPVAPEAWLLRRARGFFEQMDVAAHKRTLAYYYALVTQIDANIGRVLDELDELELTERTLVVFLSDHGEMMGEFAAWTKGAGGYEALTRVPLIVRWPGRIRAGAVVEQPVSLVDVFPTLCEATEEPVPPGVTGRSLLALARTGVDEGRSDVVFSELGHPAHGWRQLELARSATHKLVHYNTPEGAVTQLFDLARDPWEVRNLAGDEEHASVQAELEAALASWRAANERAPFAAVVPPAERAAYKQIGETPDER